MKINSQNKIGEILDRYPEALDVFLLSGFKSNSLEELIDSLGKNTMLKTVLNVKGIHEDVFINMINERVSSHGSMEEIEFNCYNPEKPLNLLVKTACPVGARFKERLSEVLKEHKTRTGVDTNCYIVGGCDAPHEYDDFGEKDRIEELPDIIMSMSFDEIYDKAFIDKFIKTGKFENVLSNIKEKYRSIGVLDESYTFNAGLVLGLLIDEKKLGDLPKPRKWIDLLDSIYRDKIVGFGSEKEGIFEYPLYYIYKLFGMEGIKKLAQNTKHIYHGAKMSKVAGTNSNETEAIHIVPLTFSELCENKNTSIVVPEEGGLIIPISFIVKKDKKEELKHITDLLLDEYGQMCSDIYGVSFNTNVRNKISEDILLNWLGWDFIYSNDLLNLGKKLKEEFHKVYDTKTKEV